MLPFRTKPAEGRLLQEGRLAGPMPWVIAIMMFLTILAAATGLAVGNATHDLDAGLSGRLTVQFPEPDPVAREAGKRAIVRALERLSVVANVEPAREDELVALLRPWLGEDSREADLPIPALIDAELYRTTEADLAGVRQAVLNVAPSARVEEHAHWLAPLASLLKSLRWLSAALVVMMLAATAATVVLTARAALNTHKAVIEVMHLLGSTDNQIAGLFQRRIALDAFSGGLIGLGGALLVSLLIGKRIDAIGSDLLGAAGLSGTDWALIVALPFLCAILATIAARLTILFALRRSL